MSWALWLTAVVAAITVVLGIEALRRPVLFRMGARNASRRPRQTATVIAGLMIGTAIVSASLVTGDSAGSAIEEAVFESLGHVDETVRIDGYPFFPQNAAEAIMSDPRVTRHFDGAAANVVWSVTAELPSSELFEPNVQLVGFQQQEDTDFGPFSLPGGQSMDGRSLGPRDAIVTASLADALEARVGDTIRVAATVPLDPAIPEVTPLNGTVSGFSAVLVDAAASAHAVDVAPSATRLTVVLGWDPRPAGAPAPITGISVRITSPDGARHAAQAAAPPLWFNVSADEVLAEGEWTVEVFGDRALETQYAGAALVWRPVYDFTSLGSGAPQSLDALDGFQPPRVETTLRVAAITDGGRGDQFDFRYAMFAPLGTVQDLLGREGEVNILKFSNPGGIRDGAATTNASVAILEDVIEDLRSTSAHPALHALAVNPVKAEFLELAATAGQLFTGFLLFAGSLSVITGLLLIINIFTMLAEERRSELGMARAVGLKRRDVVRLFLFEGSLYAVLAAAVGAVVGVGIAYALVSGINALSSGPDGFPPVPFRVAPMNLLGAFAVGSLLTFVTIALASRRASRLNIVRAIRQIDEPERNPGRAGLVLGTPLAVLGATASILGWATNQLSSQVFGPLVLAVGIGMVLRRRFTRRRLYPAIASLLALYYVATMFLIRTTENLQEANIVGPLRGVLLTFSVVVVVSYWEAGPRALASFLSRWQRFRAVARPSMAYPQHRRFRTGMTLAMFGIVILSIGFFSIFGGLFDTDPARQTGGFDIEAHTTLDVDDLAAHDRGLLPAGLVTAQHRMADHATFDLDFITVDGQRTGQFGPPVHHVYGITEEFARDQEFRLLWRLASYATDQDAYDALFKQDDVIIVAYPYSTDDRNQDLAHEVGETLRMRFGDTTRDYTIIGIQEQYHYRGVFLPRDFVESTFPNPDDVFLMKLAEGTDALEAARLIERNYKSAGIDAVATEAEIARQNEDFQRIMSAMKAYLGLGLIIGTLSLGIITSRSVLERRQEIGMMRALGFTGKQVGLVFFLEVTLTVLMGAAIGIACSLVVTYGLWYAVIRELQYPYVVPWGEVGALVSIAYAVALMATVAPIVRAARIPPAEAVRYVE